MSSRREVNASCSWVLFHLLQLCEMVLSRYCSVYTNLVISVEIQMFSLFPLCTVEPHTPQKKEKKERKISKTDLGHTDLHTATIAEGPRGCS